MQTYPLYIFDLDGTLFRGNEPTPGAVEVVAELRKRGSQIRYLTNNSGLERGAYVAKLRSLGFPAEPQEVVSSATGTASYLQEQGLKSVYVVGEPGLIGTLRAAGIDVINSASEAAATSMHDRAAEAVVAGICRGFTYDLLNGAMQAIRSGAKFVATNRDATYPVESGRAVPGAGAIVAAIATCSGTEPFVVGKPNPFLIQSILAESGIAADQALVVGDRPETDLEAGRSAGCPTHLVLCGVTETAPPGQPSSPDLRGIL